jgi:hypothetical protein
MEDPNRPVHRPLTEGPTVGSNFRKQPFTLLFALLTTICITFTSFFAVNGSLEKPLISKLVFEKPERSILVLNIASQISIFCLYEFTLSVFDAARWAFASSASGTSAYTFLVLSRATSIAGVLYLMCGKGPEPNQIRRDGHRLWGSQRYCLARLNLLKTDIRTHTKFVGRPPPVRHFFQIYLP